ncbi:MAG: hypothetical protein ACOX2L_02130 [Anaerolineae bacterium]|jgi:hypothetical protein|nr:hypothetical protein [Chloroflexota bacterium]
MTEQGPRKRSSVDEWQTLFSEIGQQIRRDIARIVGAPEDADWRDIGERTDDTVRSSAARAVGADEGADWEAIGEQLDRSTRREIGRIVGAEEGADWSAIGEKVSAGVGDLLQGLFDGPKRKEDPFEEPEDPDAPVDPWR